MSLCLCVSAPLSLHLCISVSESLSLRLSPGVCPWVSLTESLPLSLSAPVSLSPSLDSVSSYLAPSVSPALVQEPIAPHLPSPVPLSPTPARAAGLAAVSWRADNLAGPVRAAAPPPVCSRNGGRDLRKAKGITWPSRSSTVDERLRPLWGGLAELGAVGAVQLEAAPVPAGMCSRSPRSPRILGCGLGTPAAGPRARRGAAWQEESRARAG